MSGKDESGQINAREELSVNQRAFLAAFAKCGNITRACAASNVLSRQRHYDWLKESQAYRDAFVIAEEDAADLLEEEARRRAVVGLVRKKFTKDGDPIIDPATNEQYFELEYSDTLLTLLLKGNKATKFRERAELSGPNGGPIETHELTESERAAQVAAIFDAARARATGSPSDGENEMGATSGAADESGDD